MMMTNPLEDLVMFLKLDKISIKQGLFDEHTLFDRKISLPRFRKETGGDDFSSSQIIRVGFEIGDCPIG